MMKLYFITLNTSEEARQVGQALVEQRLAVCINWFPITCAYRWEGEFVEEPEVVLIVKTQSGYRDQVEQVIHQHVSYTNFIAEISPISVNQGFLNWLSVRENVQFGLKHLSKADQERITDATLAKVNLAEFSQVLPRQLSGVWHNGSRTTCHRACASPAPW